MFLATKCVCVPLDVVCLIVCLFPHFATGVYMSLAAPSSTTYVFTGFYFNTNRFGIQQNIRKIYIKCLENIVYKSKQLYDFCFIGREVE